MSAPGGDKLELALALETCRTILVLIVSGTKRKQELFGNLEALRVFDLVFFPAW